MRRLRTVPDEPPPVVRTRFSSLEKPARRAPALVLVLALCTLGRAGAQRRR